MKKAVKTVVIGTGGIACSVHLPSLAEIPDCHLAALCDIRPDRVHAAADRFGIPLVYGSYRDMLREQQPDAVFILTEPDQSFRIALDCIMSGTAVFIEKPAGVTLYQTESLAREAASRGVICQVGFNRRFIPLMRKVSDVLKGYGPLVQIDGWFFKHSDADFYGGCASAWECDMIHVVDWVRFCAGGKAQKAALLTSRPAQGAGDNAWNALIAFENGITGTVRGHYHTGGRVHGFAVHHARASAYINIGFGAQACSADILFAGERLYSLGSQGMAAPDMMHIDGMEGAYHHYYGYYDQDLAFISAVRDGSPPPCGIGEALETMRLLEMLKQSAL
jgi:predicted dehydrogenase